MKRKKISLTMIALLLIGTLTLALEIKQARAEPLDYIYINDDGSIFPPPPETPISTVDNLTYTLTGNITGKSIVILRDGITFNGNGNTVTGGAVSEEGYWIAVGIDLTNRKNVVIKNVTIRMFQVGILLKNSGKCQLYHNRISGGNYEDPESVGIKLLNSSYNTLFNNMVITYSWGIKFYDSNHNRLFNSSATDNGDLLGKGFGYGIRLLNSSYNDIFDNEVLRNHDGIGIDYSNKNSIIYNNIKYNGYFEGGRGEGIALHNSRYNTLTHNNFMDNAIHYMIDDLSYNNSWDGGYPFGGNHWSNYSGTDMFSGPYQNISDGDGIGDTPYNITSSSGTAVGQDRYPFMNPIPYTYFCLTIKAGLGGTTDPVPYTYPLVNGSGIKVTATPSVGYSFANWTLDGQFKTENPIIVTMNTNHNLTANFYNHPPYKPTLSGPSSGYVYTNIPHAANTTDPEGSNITYEFFWGYGTNTTTGWYPSGQTVTVWHFWSRPGNYNVGVQVHDFFGAQSEWSNKSLYITQNDAGSGGDAKNNFTDALFIASPGPYKGTLYNSTIPPDRYDYYKFYVEKGDTISATMSPPPGVNFDLTLYNPNGAFKNGSYLGPGYTDCVSYTADSPGHWRILINTTDGQGQYSFSVSIDVGGGCPYVSAWNGTQYVLDNNLLPSSELSNGTDVEDYYRLEHALVPRDGKYSLLISEFEQEHSYFDQVKLIAVDHESDVNIAVTPDGEILTYKNPAAPISTIDNYGNSRLNEICLMDGNVSDLTTYFYGLAGDYLVLNFGQVNSDNAKLILRDDMKSDEICIDVQILNSNGEWQTATTLTPRSYWSIEAVDLSPYNVKNQDFLVRLLWTSPHRLDFVGLDTTKQSDYEIQTANLASATHSAQGNVKALLVQSDNLYAELIPSQQIRLDFTLPNNTKKARTYILYAEGHYSTIP